MLWMPQGYQPSRAAMDASGASLLLDLVGGATAGYSTQKIRTAYAGSCIKVRRSSDNTTQDIGFSGNALDTSSLTSFVGAGNGFIDTWYDQSGNTRDMTQGTTAAQPQIVSSGSVITLNSNPCVSFTPNVYLSGAAISNFVNSGAWTVLGGHLGDTLGSVADGSQGRAIVGDTGGYFWFSYNNAGLDSGFYNAGNHEAISSTSVPLTAVGVDRYDGTTLGNFINGGSGTTTSITSTIGDSTGNMQVGKSFSAYFSGKITEVIIYNSSLTNGNCNTLGSPMATYCGATWSNM